MGGNKHKGQAQRTKNNAKPANSGRIAELVDKSHQFPSFSGVSENRISLSTTPNIDVFSSNVDPNFTVVLKKMNKKDATTRYKALQELKELCKGSSPEVIVEVLPVWCRIYTLLAIDVEHRVREAVQDVHKLIVSSVGRNLAPHLKVITPLWFLSQYDTYAPAASLASAAFQEAFPPHKTTEVITFCQAEILEYIRGNLLVLTPQDLSKGDLSKEEMELKYERVLICSLNGFALYLTKVPMKEINKYEKVLKEILSSSTFWKLSKYKSSGVRAAWFSLLSSFIQHAIYLLEGLEKNVANAVINNIDDYDSSVLSVVWEAALRSFSGIKDFWQQINMESFFLPKFANILRVGGQGNASYIYPNILLLLNSIPSSVIQDNQNFYGKIFTNFQKGMKQPLAYQSPSESEAIIASYVECIRYVIMKNIEDEAFCNLLLKNLSQVISSSMTQTNFVHQIKPLYRHLYQMLLFWLKNESSDRYTLLYNSFWKEMAEISSLNFQNSLVDKDQLQLCLNSQLTVLTVLDSPFITKRKLKVSFADTSADFKESTPTDQTAPSHDGKSVIEDNVKQKVITLAGILLEKYYTVAVEEDYKQYQNSLIIQIHKIIELFKEPLIEEVKPLKLSWTESLMTWIETDDIPTKNILSILFILLPFIESPKKEKLIALLTEKRCTESLIQGLKLATEKDLASLNDWLQSNEITSVICQEYDKIESVESASFDIVNYIWLLNKKGDFVVGNSTIQVLIKKVAGQLSFKDETQIKIASEAISIIIDNISASELNKQVEVVFDLLPPLFLNIVQGKGLIVFDTWQKGVMLLSKCISGRQFLEMYLRNLSAQLGANITSMETIFDVTLIHRAVVLLLNVLVGNDKEEMETFGMSCIRLLLTSVFTEAVQESQQRIEEICMMAEVINGNLPFETNADRLCANTTPSTVDNMNPLNSVNTLGYVNSLVFSLKIIASALGIDINSDNVGQEDEDDHSDNTVTLPSLPKESTHEFCEYLVDLTYGLVLLKKIQQYYYSTKEYFSVSCFVEPLEKDVKELVQRCKSNEQEKIMSMINIKSSTNGCLWTLVKEHIVDFVDGTLEGSCALVLKEEDSIPESVLSIPHLHKLRNVIKSSGLSEIVLNGALKIVGDRYNATYPRVSEDLCHVDRHYLILSAEVARLCEAAVAKSARVLSQNSWDFTRMSLVCWLDRISRTLNYQEHYVELVSLTNAVCTLLTTVSKAFDDEDLPQSMGYYYLEWKNVFAADAFFFLCKAWHTTIVERCSSLNHISFLHIEALGNAICTLCTLESISEWRNRSTLKEWVTFALTGILVPFVPVQITSYKLLVLLIPLMMEADESLDESSLNKISLNMLEDKLSSTQLVVLAMLQEYSTRTSCSVAPFTDSYVYTLGYLLLWDVFLQFCSQCESQQKYLYPLWIKEKDIVAPFIEAVVKLMPECVLYYPESSNKKGQELFASTPSLTFGDWTSEKLSHFCCWLMTYLMGNLPAVVRQWASEAESKQLTFVDRIVTAFISPYLCSREMEAIKVQKKPFDNMKVFTYPTVGEVIAVYTVEESSTELSIQLSNNYPLSPPKVDVSKAMVSSIQTRTWLKQLTIFLTHQNGSIWDGLILWKNNLDKKFEGIEECYICFSILHTTTHQLPKLSCHTCKKKFHSFCLYKWFSTSHKSTCPICRAIF